MAGFAAVLRPGAMVNVDANPLREDFQLHDNATPLSRPPSHPLSPEGTHFLHHLTGRDLPASNDKLATHLSMFPVNT